MTGVASKMSQLGLLLTLSLLSTLCVSALTAYPVKHLGTVYVDDKGELYFQAGIVDKKGAAYGTYYEGVNETGWAVLDVGVNGPTSGYDDQTLLRAAGYLEGVMTNRLIYFTYQNVYGVFFNSAKPEVVEKAKEWYLQEREWMTAMVEAHSKDDVVWYYAGLLLAQFEGLIAGYNNVSDVHHKLETFVFDFLCGSGDYLDLQNVVDPSTVPDFSKMTRQEAELWTSMRGHCSALIKLLPGYEDIFAAHSSWFTYSAMLRIYKHYNFVLNDKRYASQLVSFSSYPAVLSSLDDFYIMDSELVMLQTTNDIVNQSLYEKLTFKGLLAWHRVRIANWIAAGGQQWSEILAQYNTGTYNNQYMVLDLKKIRLKEEVQEDALWVVEQVPGYVHIGDQSAILREGYWASYNIPFYEDVFNMSGYPELVKKFGPSMTHDLAPRAKIFRRDQGKVTDMDTFKEIMRYNEYKTDPYGEDNPMNAICSRGDLLPKPEFGGCYDTKVTDYSLAQMMTSEACNGPTHQDQPVFNWGNFPNASLSSPHYGQPTEFKFGFVTMEPGTL